MSKDILTPLHKDGRFTAGGWNIVLDTENPKLLRYGSTYRERLEYLEWLGLLVEPIVEYNEDVPVYGEEADPPTFKYWTTVVALEHVETKEIKQDMKHITQFCETYHRFPKRDDNGYLKLGAHRDEIEEFLQDHPHAFPISRKAIRWALKRFGFVVLDDQEWNYLKCPITGVILPYDTINIDYMMKCLTDEDF